MAFNFPQGSPRPGGKGLSDSDLLRSLEILIATHTSDPQFGVPELCRKANLSPTTLKRFLGRVAQTTPGRMIRSQRLRRAGDLLRQGQLSVKEVAYTVGYVDPAAFSKAFKSEYACAPGDYARQNQTLTPDRYSGAFPPGKARKGEWEALVQQHDWLREFFQVLERYFPTEAAQVEVVAGDLLISPVQLNRRFNEVVGISPGRFIRLMRLEYAEYLLITTTYSVTAIAYEAGFSDAAHFCRTFRAQFGRSPGLHRQQVTAVSTNPFFRRFFDGLF